MGSDGGTEIESEVSRTGNEIERVREGWGEYRMRRGEEERGEEERMLDEREACRRFLKETQHLCVGVESMIISVSVNDTHTFPTSSFSKLMSMSLRINPSTLFFINQSVSWSKCVKIV